MTRTSPDASRFDVSAVYRFILWTTNPRSERLEDVLSDTSDTELFYIMQTTAVPPAARLAWSIYGHRREFAKFSLDVAETRDGVRVTLDGLARPIHGTPLLSKA